LGFTGGTQALAVVGTLVIALVLGAVTGLILRIMLKPTVMLDDDEAFTAVEMRVTDPAYRSHNLIRKLKDIRRSFHVWNRWNPPARRVARAAARFIHA